MTVERQGWNKRVYWNIQARIYVLTTPDLVSLARVVYFELIWGLSMDITSPSLRLETPFLQIIE
jgi:hypothetical protein